MTARWHWVAVAVATACASGRGGTAATPAPAALPSADPAAAQPASRPSAPPRVPDLLRYGPSVARYLVRRELHIQQGLGEPAQTHDLGTRTFLTLVISGPADSIGYPTTFTIDSVVGDSGIAAPFKESLDRAKRLVFSGRLAPGGEFRNAAPSDSVAAQALAQLLGGFRDFLPRIPRRGLELGATWTDTLERTQKRGGLEVTIHLVARGRAMAWEDHAGTRALRVESAGTYTLTGTGESAEQRVEVGGQGAGTTTAYLAADGRFSGAEARDSAALTFRFLNEGVTRDVIQVSRTTITLVP